MNPTDIDHLRVFPQQEWDFDEQEYLSYGGMELRDHFAGLAMQGFVNAWVINKDYPTMDSEVAMLSYKLADAMMKARKE